MHHVKHMMVKLVTIRIKWRNCLFYFLAGLVVDSGDSSYTLAFTATVEGKNSSVEKISSPTDSLRPLNMDGYSKVVKVSLNTCNKRFPDRKLGGDGVVQKNVVLYVQLIYIFTSNQYFNVIRRYSV